MVKQLRRLPQVVLASWLIGIMPPSVQAQVLTASNKIHSKKAVAAKAQTKSLTKILSDLERHYRVSFNYNNDLLSALQGDVSLMEDQTLNLDLKLKNLLVPNDLTFEKISPSSYIIMKARKSETEKEDASGIQVAGKKVELVVSGKVTSKAGEGLPGVTVLFKGSTIGATTGTDGAYSLTVPSADGTLIFSFIGFATKEVPIPSSGNLNVTLEEDAKALDEVVVVGYGEQKKESVTGSVASVSSAEITTTTSDNVVNMLSGKVAGMRVVARTGQPGVLNTEFDIRGLGTPLVVIDGVPSDRDLARMNPNDIESLTVLKDASAAVYGVRAANGVVLVTTKRGKGEKIRVAYDGTYGFQTPTVNPRLMNAQQYRNMINDYSRVQGNANPYSQEDVANAITYDWYNEGLRDMAPQTQHDINVSGGTEKLNFYSSLGYNFQDGFAKSGISRYERFNIRTNLSAQITQNLRAELLLSGMKDESNGGYVELWSLYKALWSQIPTDPIYINEGTLYPGLAWDSWHPSVVTNEDLSGYRKAYNTSFRGNMSLNYDFPTVKGLSAKGLYSYDRNLTENRDFQKKYSLYSLNLEPKTFATPSQLTRQYRPRTNSLLQASLNYKNSINDLHNITLLALIEQGVRTSDHVSSRRNFNVDAIDELFAGVTNDQVAITNADEVWTRVNKGVVGRVNYDFASKYLAEFSFRYDGSSRFATGNQWGFFPAASVGWRVSDENFWTKNNFLSNNITGFKLRGSYGIMGDDNSAGYQYINGYTFGGNFVQNGTAISGVNPTPIPNLNLTWYTSKTANVGFDLNFWNRLLGIEFDLFRRDRDGLLANPVRDIPGTLGATIAQENLNSDRTQGFEVNLSHLNTFGEVSYRVNANLSYTRTRNKYVERGRSVDSYDNWRNNANDRYNGVFWGHDVTGQFVSLEEAWAAPNINQSYSGNSRVLPGDYIYSDWNGDGVIDDMDMHPIAILNGSGNLNDNTTRPLYSYGLTLGGSWRGLDINLLFQGATGVWTRYPESFRKATMFSNSNSLAIHDDRYKTVNPEADPWDPNTEWMPGVYPAPTKGTSNQYSGNYAFQTREVVNASYLRLKSMEIGYALPQAWLFSGKIQGLRLFVNGFNLLTFSKMYDEVDPEKSSNQHGYEYPLTSTFNGGVGITF